jgi:hypothetical protein
MNLLSENTDGKDFSERSLYLYLDAINAYRKKREKAAGFDVLHFTFHSVTSFGSGRTIRESLESWDRSLAQMTVGLSRNFAEIGARLWKDMIPKFNMDFAPLFQIPKINELFQSAIPNLSNLWVISEKDPKSK